MTRFEAVTWASAAAVLAMLAILAPALARDPGGRYAASPHAQWFKDQHNANGDWCCDKSDGHEYDGYYEFGKDGSVTVELEGKRHNLPPYMVLKGSNPTGHAVWWYLETESMGHVDYCFSPGTLS